MAHFSYVPMKKLFERDKARRQRVISHSDVDFVIDDDALVWRDGQLEPTALQVGEERETREKEREKDKEGPERIWHEEDNPLELARMIRYLTATSSEDWTLVLEVCERASATEANAKEATKALQREFLYAKPESQLSAARLWAIMLRNASDIFLTQISSRTFIDTLGGVLTSSRTSPVVRGRLMEVIAAAAFITSSRPLLSPSSELLLFLLDDRDRMRDLWIRLKPADMPDVGIPFNTEDIMSSPPIVPTCPPIEEWSSKKSLHQRSVTPPEEDMKRLFQECRIAKRNATILGEMLAYAKPEQIEGSLVPEFLVKCRGSQELIYTQIPWASAGAERSRNEREKNAEGNGRTKTQPDIQFNSPSSRDYHGTDAKLYINAEGEQQTLEEELLDVLLDTNEALIGALRMYDDIMRVVEEQVAVEISRRDVKMDRRYMENEYLGDSYPDYGSGSSRTPSPMSSPPASPRQHDLPPVAPSQNHPLPRVPPALSPGHPYYGSPPQNMNTPTLLAPPPPPMGPRSSAFPLRPRSPDRGGLVRPSRGNLLENIGGALDRLHMDENDVEEEEVKFPIRSSAKGLGKRVVEEVDEQHNSSDSYYKPRRESVVSDLDEEVRGGDHANAMWPRRQPTQYVYDAAAERTMQYLRERRRSLDIVLGTAGATANLEKMLSSYSIHRLILVTS
ncbi:hypothetical protein F4604DRAFT_1762099 [Suillus subluteus]|nr:hypothetical protein F4604DRAFT_1762099 [Suillus subluteus]